MLFSLRLAAQSREKADLESAEPTSLVVPGLPSLPDPDEREAFEKVDCLGVPVTATRWDELRSWFFMSARRRGHPQALFFANAHTLNLAWNDSGFREVLGRADAVLNDGISLDIYAWIAGKKFAENFNGTDLFPRLFESADPGAPLRVYLYGAKPGRADAAARKMHERFANVRVVGTIDGYTRDGAIDAINAASPDLLLVGMGNPLQERWIDENRATLDVGVVAGVGALIDFLSRQVPRAPRVMRTMRVEWIYRLGLEPKRMFRRYMLGNPAFIWRSMLYVRFGVRPERKYR